MVLLAGLLVLTGCGSAGTAPAPAAGGAVDHAAGRTEVPADAQRVVALDENAGLLLYELGKQPVEALGTFSSVGVKEILTQAGTPVEPADFAAPPVERVAALNPDLIVGSATPGAIEAYPRLSQVAPTVLAGYSDPWSKQLAVAGAAVNKADVAQQRTATLQTKIDDTRRELQERGIAGQSVSVLGSISGFPFALPSESSAGELITGLGLTRPKAQAPGAPMTEGGIAVSPERLSEHDADHILVLTGSMWSDKEITGLPTAGQLRGPKATVDGEQWTNTNPFAVDWMLRDMRAVLLNDGTVGTGADVVARWRQYSGAS
ncbi:ABC transporter substrate-binding protein [Pseudonocardia endophytica]|uniref:ABC-type Fe3+-hydroxamate transport system substrate-binding protein n=1 Tax=Pseudonocardia endophytica TaxID=401976 RepID=A0A4R1HW83_PSEEN|nr:ABC transporter substrate-binding protein [Pseudonocardia endophytica]TCK25713.1 ABC-type Fe3+-hydroxamate transport system substrate-binding protein [Pseudonocardia endophytica]